MISPKYGVWHAADFERGGFSSKACVDFAMQHTFKVKCAKNWYREISGCVLWSLKDFCMPKSAQNLYVNIVLSNC